MGIETIDGYRQFFSRGKPHWMPDYDFKKFVCRFYEECGYASSPMEAMYAEGRKFDERFAFLQIVAAFNPMLTNERKYREVSDVPSHRIRKAIEVNGKCEVPTYTGLIDALLAEGVIEPQVQRGMM